MDMNQKSTGKLKGVKFNFAKAESDVDAKTKMPGHADTIKRIFEWAIGFAIAACCLFFFKGTSENDAVSGNARDKISNQNLHAENSSPQNTLIDRNDGDATAKEGDLKNKKLLPDIRSVKLLGLDMTRPWAGGGLVEKGHACLHASDGVNLPFRHFDVMHVYLDAGNYIHRVWLLAGEEDGVADGISEGRILQGMLARKFRGIEFKESELFNMYEWSYQASNGDKIVVKGSRSTVQIEIKLQVKCVMRDDVGAEQL